MHAFATQKNGKLPKSHYVCHHVRSFNGEITKNSFHVIFKLHSGFMDKGIKSLMESNKIELTLEKFQLLYRKPGPGIRKILKNINLLVCKSSPSSSNVFLIVIRNANQYFRFSIWKSDIIIGSIDDPCHAGWLPILEEMCFHTLNNQCSVCRAVAKFFG